MTSWDIYINFPECFFIEYCAILVEEGEGGREERRRGGKEEGARPIIKNNILHILKRDICK